MTLKPEPAAVGSSTTGASPPRIGDTPDMSTKPAQTSALKGTRRWGDTHLLLDRARRGRDDHRRHRADGPLPADPRGPVAGGRQGQLHHQFGIRHHRREQPALRHRRSLPGHRAQFDLRPRARGADRDRHRDLPDELRTAPARPAVRDPGRPAGRGAVDRLRPVGHLRSGPRARAVRNGSSTRTWAGSSCSATATCRSRAAAPSSPRESCWP